MGKDDVFIHVHDAAGCDVKGTCWRLTTGRCPVRRDTDALRDILKDFPSSFRFR